MNKNLPNSQNNTSGVVIRREVSQSFSGPLPHPDILRQFNEIVPGSAERIIKMAEEQSAHRKELEKKVIDSDITRSKWGQILGFVIAIAGLGVSAIVVVYGNAIAGGFIGVGTLASLVGVFMYGSKTRSKERETKNLKDKE
ncbi:MAG: DUF2335 domain-containing protein [Patescibacteria group bacterium]